MARKRNKRGKDDSFSRRDFLKVGAAGVASLSLANWLVRPVWSAGAMGPTSAPDARAVPGPQARARSVIQLWMGGGPTQTDTFDPKPEAGEDYSGPLKNPINTNVVGMRIGELLPLLAKQADKYSIIRSMTHGNDGHETAAYIMQTGTLPSADLSYPAIGAVVALKRHEAGYKGSLPAYITLTSPLGRFSDSGFLGNDYRTFATGGDPNAREFRTQGLVQPRSVTEKRLADRRDLAGSVDAMAGQDNAILSDTASLQDRACRLILGEAKTAFDMSAEKEDLREKYGRNHFGQCCLMARRLVEHGVPFITINMGGWDTHSYNFDAMKKLLPVLDAAFATLLEDLSQRGLLDTTIVTWFGEFGRTPKVDYQAPWFSGRGHYGRCFSAVVAGGGFKGGHVVGSSNFRRETVQDRPVYPWDLNASIYKLLGIDPHGRLPHPQGCVAYVTPLGAGQVQSGGLLTEIM
jgi:hypothetical protein